MQVPGTAVSSSARARLAQTSSETDPGLRLRLYNSAQIVSNQGWPSAVQELWHVDVHVCKSEHAELQSANGSVSAGSKTLSDNVVSSRASALRSSSSRSIGGTVTRSPLRYPLKK